MAEPPAAPFGALEPEHFFGRERERRRVKQLVRDLGRGGGRSLLVLGAAGSGKSEFLRQCYGWLFGEGGEILPFLYAFPRLGWDFREFAADFAAQFLRQYLAFSRRDPSLLSRPLTPEAQGELLRAQGGQAASFLADSACHLGSLPAGAAVSREAGLLPQRFAEVTGTKVLCFYDDFANLARYEPAAQRGWPSEGLRSRTAPAVVAARTVGDLAPCLGPEGAAGSLATLELGPLAPVAADQALRSLLRLTGLEMDAAARETLVHCAAGSPLYLSLLVGALTPLPAAGARDVLRGYAAEVCGGEIARHWRTVLEAALPDRGVRRTALEVLAFCLRGEPGGLEVGSLPARMFKPRGEIEAALAGLARAGVTRPEASRMESPADPVFRDFALALYRREVGGVPGGSVEAALVAERAREERRAAAEAAAGRVRDGLRQLLLAWDGQTVPADLFDATRTEEAGETTGEEEGGGRAEISLPEVLAVSAGRVGGPATPAVLEVDALAWAVRRTGERGEAAEVAWVVRALSERDCAQALDEFARAVGALQAAGELPAAGLVKWAIVPGPPDAPAAESAARHRVLTSTIGQVRRLAEELGVDAAFDQLPPAPAAPPALELEMTIPMASDTELVAASALAQLGENLELAAEDIGRVKMALVEACINAFEHSGVRGAKVHLSFAVAGGELRIRVENRGRPLGGVGAPGAGPQRGGRPQKRGWGLTLIRELMDEVTVEPREDGVSLLMVKRLGPRGAGGG